MTGLMLPAQNGSVRRAYRACVVHAVTRIKGMLRECYVKRVLR